MIKRKFSAKMGWGMANVILGGGMTMENMVA
jgi:hypothetical protein